MNMNRTVMMLARHLSMASLAAINSLIVRSGGTEQKVILKRLFDFSLSRMSTAFLVSTPFSLLRYIHVAKDSVSVYLPRWVNLGGAPWLKEA